MLRQQQRHAFKHAQIHLSQKPRFSLCLQGNIKANRLHVFSFDLKFEQVRQKPKHSHSCWSTSTSSHAASTARP